MWCSITAAPDWRVYNLCASPGTFLCAAPPPCCLQVPGCEVISRACSHVNCRAHHAECRLHPLADRCPPMLAFIYCKPFTVAAQLSTVCICKLNKLVPSPPHH